jgi:replicative DNA helicase|tara:strand:- start:608 stop:1945 length:1338 start_codon:yes stop_codon:yes gene_type:complete
MPDKPLPSSVDAECSVLGCIMTDESVYDKASAWIRTSDVFYDKDNQRVWEAISVLHKAKEPIDMVTVHNKLKDMQMPGQEKVDSYYLSGLVEDTVSAATAQHHAKIIWERYIQRQTAQSAYRLFNLSFRDLEEVNKTLESHAKLITELKELHPSRKKDIQTHINDTLENMKSGNNIIQFGMPILDWPAGGMTRKEITVLGGRPGHGKTTLMINIVDSLLSQGNKVMLFNREMSNTEMLKKIIVMKSKSLSYFKVRKNECNNGEMKTIEKVVNQISNDYKNLIMYDDIRTLDQSMREIYRYKPDVVIDDYIQLISVEGKKDRRFEIEDIMQEYKWMCKQIDCSALLLSQLNREIERRIDPKPRMSDYAESGVIEQTAETALFVFYGYNFDSDRYDQYTSELISSKTRYGQTGSYTMGFNGDRCKYYNSADLAREDVTRVLENSSKP